VLRAAVKQETGVLVHRKQECWEESLKTQKCNAHQPEKREWTREAQLANLQERELGHLNRYIGTIDRVKGQFGHLNLSAKYMIRAL
jgi:hypothetical protein